MRNIPGFRTEAVACTVLSIVLTPLAAFAQDTTFSVIVYGKNIGHLIAETKGDVTRVDFDYKSNGRGPTMKEVVRTCPKEAVRGQNRFLRRPCCTLPA